MYEAFVGPVPASLDVNHKNGDKADNTLDNLEAVTRSENIMHAHQMLGASVRSGERFKHDEETVRVCQCGEIS